MSIDTGKVTTRRKVRYETIGDLRKDLDAIQAAAKAGTLRENGNWTAGKNLTHLAAFIDYGYDGYPAAISNPPWFVKVVLRMMRGSMLKNGFRAGVKIPKVPGGTVGGEDVSVEVGLATLRRSLERLEAGPPRFPSPAFGELSYEDSKAATLRHAELHLSFLMLA